MTHRCDWLRSFLDHILQVLLDVGGEEGAMDGLLLDYWFYLIEKCTSYERFKSFVLIIMFSSLFLDLSAHSFFSLLLDLLSFVGGYVDAFLKHVETRHLKYPFTPCFHPLVFVPNPGVEWDLSEIDSCNRIFVQ